MIKHRKFIFVIISLLAVFVVSPAGTQDRGIMPVPNTPAGKVSKGQNWLFVIGINKYDHWPGLKSAVNDAKSLKRVLTSQYFFDDEHTVELYDKEATREGILGKLRYLAAKVKPDDSLMIFYAGHGHIDPITKVGSWIPVESQLKTTASYLSNFDVKSYLKIDAIKAKHILLISDSCFAGEFFRSYRNAPSAMKTKKYIKKAYELPSRMAITSGGLEPVSDEGFGGNSIFTYYLLEALKANSRPFLLPSEIFLKIKEDVAENASQFPRFGNIAGTGGQQGGEMVFFLRRDTSLEYESNLLSKQKQIEELEELERKEKLNKEKREKILEEMEKKMASLDKRILELRENLEQKGVETSGNLDELYSLVKEKEEHAANLAELKYKRRYEESIKLAEIAQVELFSAENLRENINEDLKKFEEISNSRFGKQFTDKAWIALGQKYPAYFSGLSIGETKKVVTRIEKFEKEKRQEFMKTKRRVDYLETNREKLILGFLRHDAMVDSIVKSKQHHGKTEKVQGQNNVVNLKKYSEKIYFSKHTPPQILSGIKKSLVDGPRLSAENLGEQMSWSRKGKTIFSENSNLMWMAMDYRNINGRHPLNLEEIRDWMVNLNNIKWGGYDDWRLPTIEELKKLYTQEETVHSFTGKRILGYPSAVEGGPGYFLISSDYFKDELVWAFGFFSGRVSVVRKDTGYVFGSARLVRSQ